MMRRVLLMMLTLLMLALPALAEENLTVLGVEVEPSATALDLSSLVRMSKKQALELSEALQSLPDVVEVDLRSVEVNRDGQAALLAAHPGIHFRWEVPIGMARVDGDLSELDLDALQINARRVEMKDIRQLIACLPNLKHLTMYTFVYTKAEMEQLLADFPDIDFKWSVHWRMFPGVVVNWHTDTTAFSTMKSVQMKPRYTADQLMEYLKHMPDLLAIDVGHNDVSDLSFLTNWPNLRRLICVESTHKVTDISPLAELMDLEYVELFLQNITDISPLANHTKLLDLNLCHNDITDLSPLYSCTNLERLHISYNEHLTEEEVAKLQEALPNCVIETETYQSTGAGWRGHPRYFIMYQSFEDRVYYPFEETAE